MNTSVYLLLILVLSLIIIAYLVSVLLRVRIQLTLIKDALEDIKNGNLNRRILTDENDITKQICYDINEIAINSQFQLIQQKQSEQAYKQLMTSLSHDVKTPLASLVGYLEAVESKIVVGEVKLDSKEQVFHFDIFDLNELSRNIISDWIPVLESSHFEYEFDIPEIENFLRIDANAYTRIINNLLQNIITHSSGNKMTLRIFENKEQAQIIITDNGKGISSDNLPHIFERLYQCDHSRASKGNGLGLAIAKELINAHKGNITANSTPGMGTEFTILLPKAL